MKSLTSLITVSLMLAAGTALAHEPQNGTVAPAASPQTMDHSKMDMSGMTPADSQKMAAAEFAKLDADKNGSLSKVEFAKLHAMMGMQHGQMDGSKMDTQQSQMDHSKMGMSGMSAADQQKMATAQFAKLDSNNDGKLSKGEFAGLHSMMGMRHGSMDHSKMDMQHGQMDHSKMDHSKMDMSNKPTDHQKMTTDEFAKFDSNKDGELSKAEVSAQPSLAAHFGMLDANKDGSLSKAEFAKHHGM